MQLLKDTLTPTHTGSTKWIQWVLKEREHMRLGRDSDWMEMG